MQFKMAENSLFAVLLRARWWYSLILALVLVFLVAMAFGGKYVVFGIAGALPFFVISGMAAYKQWQAPSARLVEETIESVSGLSAKDFTARVSDAYEREGYEVKRYSGEAADLELTQGWRIILVSTKRFKAAGQGVEPLRALKEAGRKHEATALKYVFLGDVTANAQKFATDNNIDLINAQGIAGLLAQR